MSKLASPALLQSGSSRLVADTDDPDRGGNQVIATDSSMEHDTDRSPSSRDMTPGPPSPPAAEPTENPTIEEQHPETDSDGASLSPEDAPLEQVEPLASPLAPAVSSQWAHTALVKDRPVSSFFTNPTSRWRVKLYTLEDGGWLDAGTGLCWGEIANGRASVIVEDEAESGGYLLETHLKGRLNYQKQDTLIVWSERIDGKTLELALSFQEVLGCLTICEFILHVGATIAPEIAFYTTVTYLSDSPALAIEPVERIPHSPLLPPGPACGNIDRVLELLDNARQTHYGRDILVHVIRQEDYLRKLIPVFHDLEQGSGDARYITPLQRLKSLRGLSQIIRLIFSLMDASLVVATLDDDIFPGILGILEYDIDFAPKKAAFRKFFAERTHLNEVAQIDDALVVEKIHKTYRLQVLKDVVLTRIVDDNVFSMISSLIYVNQMDVIVSLQSSSEFTRALFKQFQNVTEQDKGCDDGLRLIYHIVATSTSFQQQQRVSLYLVMVENGLLPAILYGLFYAESDIRGLALEIVIAVLEANSGLIRSPTIASDSIESLTIADGLISVLKTSQVPGVQLQACEALKLYLEPTLPEDAERLFFERSAQDLFRTLGRTEDFPNSKSAHYYELVIDLCGYCQSHSMFAEIVDKLDLWRLLGTHVSLPLSKASALAAVRSLKWMLLSSNVEANEAIIDSGVLSALVGEVLRLKGVDNALHSACLQLLVIIVKDQTTKLAPLRKWLAENESERLVETGFLLFRESLLDEETSEDESRHLKRPQAAAETPQNSQRRRLDTPDHSVSLSPAGVDRENSASPESSHNFATNGNGSPVLRSPPLEPGMSSPSQAPSSPPVAKNYSPEGSSNSPVLGVQAGRSHSLKDSSDEEESDPSAAWSPGDHLGAPGTPKPGFRAGSLQRRFISAGNTARRLVNFKRSAHPN